MSKPWYHAGLNFQCRKCGRCCTGEPGYVWVSEEDITKIAQELSLDRSLFESSFVKTVSRYGKSLVEYANGDCVLYDPETKMCKVYESRPIQCRTWPFWEQNLDLPSSWNKTAKFCPGCNHGTLITQEQIEQQVEKTAFP